MLEWKPSYLKEIYTDVRGVKWLIRDLLVSQIPRRLLQTNVDYIWSLNSHRRLWSNNVGSLEEVICSPTLQEFLDKSLQELHAELNFQNTTEAHLNRIAAIIMSLKIGWLPPPIITVEGKVWDGAHRLCAFKYLSLTHIGVLEFYDLTELSQVPVIEITT